MSVHITSPVWRLNLPPKPKLVLLKLADCANPHSGFAFPSIETISRDTGVARRTVQLILAEFRESGVLVVQEPGGGRRKATTYSFDLKRAQLLHGFPDAAGEAKDAVAARYQSKNGAAAAPFPSENGAAGDRNRAAASKKPCSSSAPEPKGTDEPSRARTRDAGAAPTGAPASPPDDAGQKLHDAIAAFKGALPAIRQALGDQVFCIIGSTMRVIADNGEAMRLAQPTRMLKDLTEPHLDAIARAIGRQRVELVLSQAGNIPPPHPLADKPRQAKVAGP